MRDGCDYVNRHAFVLGTGFNSPNLSISDLAAIRQDKTQVSLETKEKETELEDWCCCVQAKKSDASWIVTFCRRTASSAIRLTEPPIPSQGPLPWPASKEVSRCADSKQLFVMT